MRKDHTEGPLWNILEVDGPDTTALTISKAKRHRLLR